MNSCLIRHLEAALILSLASRSILKQISYYYYSFLGVSNESEAAVLCTAIFMHCTKPHEISICARARDPTITA